MEIRREWRFYSAVVMAQVLRTAVVKAAERKSAEAQEEQAGLVNSVQTSEISNESMDLIESDSAGARLERERMKTDERQRELEAEQLRLEEEQKRLEERRQAIVAEKAFNSNIAGKVSVDVTLDEEGNVASAKAVSGHQMLRVVCEDAARRSKFKPVLFENQPSKAKGVIIYNFVAGR